MIRTGSETGHPHVKHPPVRSDEHIVHGPYILGDIRFPYFGGVAPIGSSSKHEQGCRPRLLVEYHRVMQIAGLRKAVSVLLVEHRNEGRSLYQRTLCY